MQDIQSIVHIVKEQIQIRIKYSDLLNVIPYPNIDEERIILIVSLLKEANLSDNECEQIAIVTMLIQIALDTHENVTNSKPNEGMQEERQLMVLAGDYYSGLYYKLLAEINELTLIKALSSGIKDVNESKIALYQKTAKDMSGLLEHLAKVESALFYALTDAYSLTKWREFSACFLLLRRLIAEKKQQIVRNKQTVFIKAYNDLLNGKNNDNLIIEHLAGDIHLYKEKLEAFVQEESFLNKQLKEVTNNLIQECSKKHSYVEEG